MPTQSREPIWRYKPIKEARHFTKERMYSEVNWDDFEDIVRAFKDRINQWYIKPAANLQIASAHNAFAIMAINCLLIDTLSQFEKGLPESDKTAFIDFIKNRLSEFGFVRAVDPEIIHWKPDGRQESLGSTAQVIYFGFRCGILHQAHAPLYCRIDPGIPRIDISRRDYTTYKETDEPGSPVGPCPTVTINPWDLFKAIRTVFRRYCEALNGRCRRDEDIRELRRNFAKKFKGSFGVEIADSTLEQGIADQ